MDGVTKPGGLIHLGLRPDAATQANAQSARATKDANRTALEVLIRALVRRLQASPSVSHAERAVPRS